MSCTPRQWSQQFWSGVKNKTSFGRKGKAGSKQPNAAFNLQGRQMSNVTQSWDKHLAGLHDRHAKRRCNGWFNVRCTVEQCELRHLVFGVAHMGTCYYAPAPVTIGAMEMITAVTKRFEQQGQGDETLRNGEIGAWIYGIDTRYCWQPRRDACWCLQRQSQLGGGWLRKLVVGQQNHWGFSLL